MNQHEWCARCADAALLAAPDHDPDEVYMAAEELFNQLCPLPNSIPPMNFVGGETWPVPETQANNLLDLL